ncbi:glycosyltransferase family 4 protein [Cupriavidus respiraculi]|uniref:D-inositol-3-phosphate glycosyltransferase n=1 Tax=Cupriavidus respiraculi TaxID=195930 RepID=A0ABM8WPJ7_9BURK|nr:glycosyltransferase family 4 protein [Cupriavidus respiraculi]MBY4947152.1 glycosyltransferase family 4 protein [Cupriavidus respiraculi]CAG9169348.1 D-inositol-3-phosphate glycosyltransferase [Cupriavidus respiraculi]
MKVAFLTTYDTSDPHAWSGSARYILRALRASNLETEVIDKLSAGRALTFYQRVKTVAYRRLLARTYQRERAPSVARRYAHHAERCLRCADCDVVFSPGTLPIACLESDKPIAFWTDACFAGMLGFYPNFSNFCAETVRTGNRLEQQALTRASVAIYSSEWAAATALRHYDVDPAKVKVVPFGANVDCARGSADIEHIARARRGDVCRLLLVGVDWERKGGDTALAVASLLNRQGIATELHVVGCQPPFEPPPFVKLHGFISKASEAGRHQFDALMSGAHFLIVPSRAECFGVVFAEASSFGLPSLATRTGGVCTVVRDGRNGMTFDLDADPQAYCDYIGALMSEPAAYMRLCQTSYGEYAQRLNWGAAGRRVRALLQASCH